MPGTLRGCEEPFEVPRRPPPKPQLQTARQRSDGTIEPDGPGPITAREVLDPHHWWKGLTAQQAAQAVADSQTLVNLSPPSASIRELAQRLAARRRSPLGHHVDIWLLVRSVELDVAVLARALAAALFRDPDAVLVIDCSRPENDDDRIFGTPPGYGGHLDGGIATNQLRLRPASVIVFDNVEYADSGTLYKLRSAVRDEPWRHVVERGGRIDDLKLTDALIIMSSARGTRAIPADGQPTGEAPSAHMRFRQCILKLRARPAGEFEEHELSEIFDNASPCTWGVE